MPVHLRIFYLRRLNKHFKDKNKAEQDAMKKAKSKSASRPKIRRR